MRVVRDLGLAEDLAQEALLTALGKRWAAQPIETFQPGSRWAPLVIGPGDLPVMKTARAIRREPELAVLSALAAARRPGAGRRVGLLLRVLSHADPDLASAFAATAVDILVTTTGRRRGRSWKHGHEAMVVRTRWRSSSRAAASDDFS